MTQPENPSPDPARPYAPSGPVPVPPAPGVVPWAGAEAAPGAAGPGAGGQVYPATGYPGDQPPPGSGYADGRHHVAPHPMAPPATARFGAPQPGPDRYPQQYDGQYQPGGPPAPGQPPAGGAGETNVWADGQPAPVGRPVTSVAKRFGSMLLLDAGLATTAAAIIALARKWDWDFAFGALLGRQAVLQFELFEVADGRLTEFLTLGVGVLMVIAAVTGLISARVRAFPATIGALAAALYAWEIVQTAIDYPKGFSQAPGIVLLVIFTVYLVGTLLVLFARSRSAEPAPATPYP